VNWIQVSETVHVQTGDAFNYDGPYSKRKVIRLIKKKRRFLRILREMNMIQETFHKHLLARSWANVFNDLK
jgi:hypothetical protein